MIFSYPSMALQPQKLLTQGERLSLEDKYAQPEIEQRCNDLQTNWKELRGLASAR